MNTISLDLEADLVAMLHQLNQPIQQAARELIVLELYRRGTISSGKAAELLGMARQEFIGYASRLGIPYFAMTEDEWDTERRRSESLCVLLRMKKKEPFMDWFAGQLSANPSFQQRVEETLSAMRVEQDLVALRKSLQAGALPAISQRRERVLRLPPGLQV